uniref:hypothetical protein n=1 Tax=Flavobacterium sp. TaxID=239 RepID=UPI00404AF886
MDKLLKYIIPINVLFDVSLAFFEKGGFFPILRAILMMWILGYFIYKNPHNYRYYSYMLIFSLYVLTTLIFSNDVLRSLNISLKVIISILFFIVGFNYFNSLKRFKVLNNSIIIALIVLLINFIVSTVFGIGVDVYTGDDDFLAGNLDDNWNIFTYALLISPLILFQYIKLKNFRLLLLALIGINSIILLLSLKRIAVAGLAFGLIIYTLFNFKLGKSIKGLFFITLFLILTFPLYEKQLFKRFEAREDRFQSNSLESEARYAETIFVWEETMSFEKPIKSILGLQGFYSTGNYADGKFGDRNLHIDYNLIVNTTGLVGLALYLIIFVQIFRNFLYLKKAKAYIPQKFYNMLVGVFFALFITQFVTSFAGQMYMITFRMIIFTYMGAILGYFKMVLLKNQKNRNAHIDSL